MLTRLIGLFAAFAVVIGSALASDLDDIRARGTLRVGVAELAPFVVRAEDGSLTGYEIENATRLAQDLGVEPEFVEVAFCDLPGALADGKADIIASGFSMTDERRKRLDYSLPYHKTPYHVVVASRVAKRKKTLEGLDSADVSLGYIIGGVSGVVAKDKFPHADLKPYSSRSESFFDVISGRIDGVVSSDPFYEYVLNAKPGAFVVPKEDEPLFMTIEAFAVRKGQDDFLDVLNAWVVARDRDGFSKALYRKWFKSMSWPINAPNSIQCQGEQT